MCRVIGSPCIVNFRCWTRSEVTILGADQKEHCLWDENEWFINKWITWYSLWWSCFCSSSSLYLASQAVTEKKTSQPINDKWVQGRFLGYISAGTGKLCILGHLGIVFIWSCFVSCLLFLLLCISLRNLCFSTRRKIRFLWGWWSCTTSQSRCMW